MRKAHARSSKGVQVGVLCLVTDTDLARTTVLFSTIETKRVIRLGDLAQHVLDKRIPLEICLLSNVHTGAARSLSEHPFKIYQEKFSRHPKHRQPVDERYGYEQRMRGC